MSVAVSFLSKILQSLANLANVLPSIVAFLAPAKVSNTDYKEAPDDSIPNILIY